MHVRAPQGTNHRWRDPDGPHRQNGCTRQLRPILAPPLWVSKPRGSGAKRIRRASEPSKPVGWLLAAARPQSLEEARRKAQKAQAEKERAQAALQAALDRLKRLKDEVQRLSVSDEAKQEAETRLAENHKALEERARVEGEWRALQRALQDVRRQLAALEERLRLSQRAKSWVELLTRLREVFHRGALPALVHQTALEDLMEQVNGTLEELDAPFRMSAKEELEMEARFEDGRVVPAADLSGGEKMLFAIAFRLAVSAKFASQVGLLVLDEPTACVDRQNVERLVQRFAHLGRLARSRNNQILVVTHEELLRPVFDQVLSVPDGSSCNRSAA